MANNAKSRAMQIANLKKAIEAMQTKLPTGVTLSFNGGVQPQAQVVNGLQGVLDMFEAVEKARQQLQQAQDALRESGPANSKFINGYKSAVATLFGASNPVVSDFGVTPRKRTAKLTVDEKKKKNDKAKATREAKDAQEPTASPSDAAKTEATAPSAATGTGS